MTQPPPTTHPSTHPTPHPQPRAPEHPWGHVADQGGKGEAATQPVPIRPASTTHDFFDVTTSPAASTSSSFHGPSPSLSFGSSDFYPTFDHPELTTVDPELVQDLYDSDEMRFTLSSSKGKQRDGPPTLPPLSFSGVGLGYEQSSWSSFGSIPSPGPSSYGSVSSQAQDLALTTAAQEPAGAPTSADSAFSATSARHMPSRCRSLSNLSLRSTPSLASLTMSKIRVKLGPQTTQSNLARKLLKGKRGDNSTDSGASSETASLSAGGEAFAAASSLNLDPNVVPWYAAPLQPSLLMLRAKGRSKSSPIPFSALNIVPPTHTDVFKPLPLRRRNYIDQLLPKELQLQILKSFVQLFEDNHVKVIADGRWTISKAISSRYQLVGRDHGIRELLKLARVSRSWQNLVFDGQLWADLDLHSFPRLPESVLLRFMRSGGPFIRRIDFAGHCLLQPTTLTELTHNLCPRDTLSYTHLTVINLQGCSALTTRSLHHLLVRCRSLRRLCLKGLAAVTNTTCELLATFCTQLEYLNLNRCPNMDAEGIRHLSRTTLAQGECLRLKELRISGLKHMDDATMRVLGKAAPHLEVLDLSYVRQLHNSALESFVAVDDASDYGQFDGEIIRLNARQVGRDFSNDRPQLYSRRVTKLRHLSLSFCILLTDMACSNLAFTVPHLEFLEMAGIGADLKDDGIIRLLETTPHIRRLDMEDASDITDSVLSCISPVDGQLNSGCKQGEQLQPGQTLEWLSVSHAGNLTDEAFLSLIRACPKLRVLEADNTRLSGGTLKEFVNLNRQRKAINAKVVAIDCRNVVEGVIKDLGSKGATRPRLGVRKFWARKLGYVDESDELCEEDLKVGQDECDPTKVVVKSFYSWQTVDSVRSAREKRKKATSRRAGSPSSDYLGDVFDSEFGGGSSRGTGLTRWWSPNSRPGSGRNSPPIIPDITNDGCIIM
ncbi:F-box/LRR-repeat protein 2 [Leucoagaricus sp. SymC.cos]|nr:F-box/LRR-repeat protein 2 [Leucoagaricus sp. SymC.cos]